MYRKLLHSEIKTINSAAYILAGASLISGLLGVFRDHLLFGSFGAGRELDIYYTAFRIPDFVSMVLVMGAISAAIIPIFSGYLAKSKEEAWNYFSNLLNVFLISLIAISVILIIFVPQILLLIAPGFSEETRNATVELTRIMFLSPILLGISNILSGVLRVFKRFLVTSIAPILYNIGIIIGIVFFAPTMGLKGLAWGVVLGAFLHLLIQLPALFKLGFVFKRKVKLSDPGILRTIKLTIPRAIGLAAGQINLIVITAIASTLAVGSISIFNGASNLQNLPITLIAVSFSTAAFPFLSLHFARKEKEKLVQEFSNVFRKILFFILPIGALIFLLRIQIIRVAYGTGRFDWTDTQLTAACLGIFSLGIFAYALSMLVSKTFYAFQNTRIPAMVTLATVALNVTLCYFFIQVLNSNNVFQRFIINFLDLDKIEQNSVIGLPLALVVSGIFQLIVLLILLKKTIGDFKCKEIGEAVLKILASTVLLSLACYFVRQLTASYVNMNSFIGIFTQALLASLAGIAVYLVSTVILNRSEGSRD
ncbi:murein biosynthesis integral membrane protein MurJ [Patescibacteria group bacterium]|nr:murein biosynthesis integral membrane protein MurJ [Patescibacteria group bacterium]